MKFSSVLGTILIVAAVLFVTGVFSKAKSPRTVTLYGFSILSEVINKGIGPAFKKNQFEKTGDEVELLTSFAGSGTIANQLKLGVPAQIAILAHQHDALKLLDAGVVKEESWSTLPSSGSLLRTPVVLVVRKGNPQKIQSFSDLGRSGVKIIQPDPLVSGGAAWGLLAIYGSSWVTRHDQENATDLLEAVAENVTAQASSARAARTQFEQGFGDVLITYEQEALASMEQHKDSEEIVYPANTIYCEPLVMRIDRYIDVKDQTLINDLIEFMWSAEGQAIFQQYSFRSADGKSDRSFTPLKDPFTVTALGGWRTAYDTIVDGAWRAQQSNSAE